MVKIWKLHLRSSSLHWLWLVLGPWCLCLSLCISMGMDHIYVWNLQTLTLRNDVPAKTFLRLKFILGNSRLWILRLVCDEFRHWDTVKRWSFVMFFLCLCKLLSWILSTLRLLKLLNVRKRIELTHNEENQEVTESICWCLFWITWKNSLTLLCLQITKYLDAIGLFIYIYWLNFSCARMRLIFFIEVWHYNVC